MARTKNTALLEPENTPVIEPSDANPVDVLIEPPVTGVKPEAAIKAVRKLTPEDYEKKDDEVYARIERIFTQIGIVGNQEAINTLMSEYVIWSTKSAERELLAAKQRKLANMQRRQEKLRLEQEKLQGELSL